MFTIKVEEVSYMEVVITNEQQESISKLLKSEGIDEPTENDMAERIDKMIDAATA
jgi:hypothetical protein